MKAKERKELALSKIILIILALVGLLFVMWFAWIRPAEESAEINSFEECVEAGYPVQESDPEVCVTPNGQRFSNTYQQ